LAETTGTSGAAGSEFPVFKAGEGAFDRAKYEEQDKARVVSDGVNVRLTGKEIDEDLKVKKKSADEVIKNARKFYNESFEKNLKELGEGIDTKAIYFTEAYSGADSDRSTIGRKIDKGETIDGKEIFEMSKQAAENKIGNAKLLKDGRVTDIVENLGLRDVMEFDLFEDVQRDFDSKIKDEKIKFDPLLDKFAQVLDYFGVTTQPAASQYAPILYTPENMAIISALAKVLEAEGFTNESITKMSKAYDDNIKKLIEKKEGKKAEDVIKEAAQEAKKEETATKTEEQKLEEKKSEEPKKDLTAENKDAKVDQPKEASTATTATTTEEPKKTDEKKEPEVKTAEQKLEEKKPEEKKDGGKGKVEDVKTENKKGKKGKETTPALSESNKGILEMLGLKMPSKEGDKKEGEGEGGDEKGKGKGKGKGTTTGSAEVDKTLEELGFKKPKEESGGTKGKESKTEKKETKLDEKVSTNTGKKTETSTTNTPIKETTTQNLSSVNTPTTDKAEDKKEDTKTTTNTTTSTENKTEDKKSDTGVKTEEVQQKEEGNKEKTGDQDKMIKELGDNMKSMVTLLSQLNNTMKNPLIVIPNGKKFH
jgi:hypothetical protein